MTIDLERYDDPETARELARRTRGFVDGVVVPTERELAGGTAVSEGTVSRLRGEARECGVYAPQMPERYGGGGYSFREALPAFEQAGRPLLGPVAMRVDAPDEGSMHLLELVGDDLRQEHYPEPLVAGEKRSGFSMTEPAPGGGSDPKMVKTRAEKEASSLSLVPTEAPGVNVVRNIPHTGGDPRDVSHAEIKHEGVRVPEEHLLGEEGEGFTHVQQRLGPARLTHCMRYSGMARRALDVAKAYLDDREGFGSKLSEKQAPRFEIAEAAPPANPDPRRGVHRERPRPPLRADNRPAPAMSHRRGGPIPRDRRGGYRERPGGVPGTVRGDEYRQTARPGGPIRIVVTIHTIVRNDVPVTARTVSASTGNRLRTTVSPVIARTGR